MSSKITSQKTKAKKSQELNHVLNVVLNLEKDHIIQLILRGPARVISVEILLGLSKEDLLSFECTPATGGNPESLNRSDMSLVRVFKSFIWHLNTIDKSVKNDFLLVDPTEFDDFRI